MKVRLFTGFLCNTRFNKRGNGSFNLSVLSESQEEAAKTSSLQQQKQLSRATFLAIFAVCTVTYSAYTLLLHVSQTDKDGNFPWLTGSMVLVTELAKLCLSLSLLGGQWYWQAKFASTDKESSMQSSSQQPIRLPRGAAELLAYGVPALLYTINNNLGVYLQLQMDPVSFQILSNLKILTTALLFRIIMQQKISNIQWLSMLILFCAGISNSIGGLAENSNSSSKLHVTPTGLCMLLIYCSISGLAGVYTEYVLKRQAVLSVHLQNSLLYVYGIVLNLFVFGVQSLAYNKDFKLLQGFDGITWTLVASQAIGGISMGILMKFASNIAKLFVVSTAMLLTTIATVILFNFSINIYCVVAFICVVTSQYMYYYGCTIGACK